MTHCYVSTMTTAPPSGLTEDTSSVVVFVYCVFPSSLSYTCHIDPSGNAIRTVPVGCFFTDSPVSAQTNISLPSSSMPDDCHIFVSASVSVSNFGSGSASSSGSNSGSASTSTSPPRSVCGRSNSSVNSAGRSKVVSLLHHF